MVGSATPGASSTAGISCAIRPYCPTLVRMEWVRVEDSAGVITTPRAVVVDGVPLVVLRPEEGAAPVAFADRCPHRLVPLSAGTAAGGALQCRYHGWRFDTTGR